MTQYVTIYKAHFLSHLYKAEESAWANQNSNLGLLACFKANMTCRQDLLQKKLSTATLVLKKKYGHTVKMCNDWQVHNQGFLYRARQQTNCLAGIISPPGLTVVIILKTLLLNETPELHWKIFWILIPVDKIPWQETKVSRPVLRSIYVGDVALCCPETSGISVIESHSNDLTLQYYNKPFHVPQAAVQLI